MPQDPPLPTFSKIYAFGDSLSDAGNLSIATSLIGTTPASPPYYQESYGLVSGNVFSNGPTWVQDLSQALSLGTLEPSLIGGDDFAYGGAETGSTPQNAGEPDLIAISLPSQLVQFQTFVPTPSANALYTLSIGSNDVLDILSNQSLTAQQQLTDVNDAVNNEISFVNSLVQDGAQNLLVLNVPDLGLTPDVTQGLADGSNTPSPLLDSEATQLSSDYDTALSNQLANVASTDHVSVHIVDAFSLIDDAVANMSAYGLTNVTSPVWTGNYTGTGGTLEVSGTAAQDQYLFFDHLHPTETGEMAIATLAEDALSGQQAPCFAAGTRIATERGDVLVQQLRVGDRVLLAEGGSSPVIWLGHRRVRCGRHPRAHDVQPVRVAAHAFGAGQPHGDVWLSPDHAVPCGGVLIPVRYLVNGRTIVQERRESITYWHVELERHAVLLAQGLPCESYLDTGNRAAFANGGAAVQAHPDFARGVWRAQGCAPLVLGGPKLATARAAVLEQAAALGFARTDDPMLRVTAAGRDLAVASDGAIRFVSLPRGTTHVRIASRTWVPAMTRADEEDGRSLGVAIGGIWLDRRAASLESPALISGWHAAEPGWRWTDGAGDIVLGGEVRELVFSVVMTGTYWADELAVETDAAVA